MSPSSISETQHIVSLQYLFLSQSKIAFSNSYATIPMLSFYRQIKTCVLACSVFTDAQHQWVFAVFKCFRLVTQHINCCCHSFSGLHLGLHTGLHKPPKSNQKTTKKAATFYRNCLIFKWCHQKMSSISKWLYIFALKNHNKRNLPLLLHLISAPFCSVSQSRVPTFMQRQ